MWFEDDVDQFSSGPYTDYNNAYHQYLFRIEDPWSDRVSLYQMTEIENSQNE